MSKYTNLETSCTSTLSSSCVCQSFLLPEDDSHDDSVLTASGDGMEYLQKLFSCCFETEEQRERRARRLMLEEGGSFRKKIHTLGFSFGRSEAITLKAKVSDESGALVLVWRSEDDSDKSGVIRCSEIVRAEPKGEEAWTLTAKNGDLLLETMAESTKSRDEWLLAIREAASLDTKRRETDSPKPSSISSRAKKQAYFMQKELELTTKKAEADKRKQKYLQGNKGGMKYTALAMANRD